MPSKIGYSTLSGQLESPSMAEKGVRTLLRYGGQTIR
jgi:hypothetical protein